MQRNAERRLVAGGGALFGLSLLFPLAASMLLTGDAPRWLGLLDVSVALALMGTVMVIDSRAQGHVNDRICLLSYRVYRQLATLLLVLLVLYFVVGDRIAWDILVPGLAWRCWALCYAVPSALALWGSFQGRENLSDQERGA